MQQGKPANANKGILHTFVSYILNSRNASKQVLVGLMDPLLLMMVFRLSFGTSSTGGVCSPTCITINIKVNSPYCDDRLRLPCSYAMQMIAKLISVL